MAFRKKNKEKKCRKEMKTINKKITDEGAQQD